MHGRIWPNPHAQNVTIERETESVRGETPDALAGHLARFDAVWAALSPDERRRLRTMRVDNDTRTDLVTVSFGEP